MAWLARVAKACATRGTGAPALLIVAALASTAFSQQGPALPNAPDPQQMLQGASKSQTPGENAVPKASAGQMAGTIVDGDGDIVPGAQVALVLDGIAGARTTVSDDSGVFRFTGVPWGKFTVSAVYPGMTGGTFIGVLHAGEPLETLRIKLDASASESVQVVATQEELAEAEIHVEEHQRILGVMPNFFTAYDWHAAPLRAKQKFELAWKNVIDPGNFFVDGVAAGIQYWQDDFSGYGRGPAGYARRYGAATGDLVSGTYLGAAIFPSLFRQDPRYFYKGTGTIKGRTWYAISRVWRCRGDNGKEQFNYSGIVGDLAAGALSNAYYPASNRQGPALTFENGGLNLLADAAGNLVQEFALKRLTPHAPTYGAAIGPSIANPPAATQH